MTQRIKGNDLDFSKEDQNNINNFSKLNMNRRDKEKQIAQKKELIDQLDDALTELDLFDDDEPVKVKFGDCFFGIVPEQARENTEKNIEFEKNLVDDLNDNLEETQKKIKKLKAVLYTKFGNTIQLEED
ncbi:Prefoldin [Pseudocohnilembus persalinus]|uniref:Prefoldin subunit 4 n=1 Tax=Pseudocohnilembus persalinus TaxID=266149 RepID=A0A0V0R611_PSEPJ|nr:Prefoldin [Pseudocohnilembus persalinus]|eukprot:KRX09937.1 Prefoldin [Pseudocohnilembus persalinus]